MNTHQDGQKELKRKHTEHSNHDDLSSHSEKKRRKKDGKPVSSNIRPNYCPLSERQQLALLMQMTAEENNEQTSTTPAVKKTPGSGKKDKVNKRNERGETPLHLATIRGELPVIIDLVKQGADINAQDYAGWTPLHEACNHGYEEIAKYLLERGATVNSQGFNNDYPLHDAVTNEYVDLVELLLKHGANPLLPNKQGERPLDLTDNEEIKRMMQNEIISSDESDRVDSPTVSDMQIKSDTNKPRMKSEDRSDEKTQCKTSLPTASRELFKQFESSENIKRCVTSSSDSEDSDDVPLSHKRKSLKQTSSRRESTASLKEESSSSNIKRKKNTEKWNRRDLFSSDSSDSSGSDDRHPRYEPKPSLSENHRRQSTASDDVPLSQAVKHLSYEDDCRSNDEDKPAESKISSPVVKNTTISSSKTDAPDVYDFSLTSDEFSAESDGISLKPENRSFSIWESPVKSSNSYSRKPQSIFSPTKTFEFGAKKPRKPSWDNFKSSEAAGEKISDDKTVLIRPIHETSEMMFDRLFKPSKKVNEEVMSPSNTVKPSFLTPKNVSVIGASQVNVTTSATFTTPSFMSSVSSASGITNVSKTEKSITLSPSIVFSNAAFATTGQVTTSNNPAIPVDSPRVLSKPGLITDVNRSCSVEASHKNLSHTTTVFEANEKPDQDLTMKSSTATETEIDKAHRTPSLDSKASVKKKQELEKTLKNESTSAVEHKTLKKIIKTEIKEKISKTFSDPVKKAQLKSVAKENNRTPSDSKKLSAKPKLEKSLSGKKDTKIEKKTTFLPESKSSFMTEIEKGFRQRNEERMKRKKMKSSILVKGDDKKVTKKPEVKLIETDSWLGSPAEKTLIERQKKLQQRSLKRSLDDNSSLLVLPSAEKTSSNQTTSSGTPSDFVSPIYSTSSPLLPTSHSDSNISDKSDSSKTTEPKTSESSSLLQQPSSFSISNQFSGITLSSTFPAPSQPDVCMESSVVASGHHPVITTHDFSLNADSSAALAIDKTALPVTSTASSSLDTLTTIIDATPTASQTNTTAPSSTGDDKQEVTNDATDASVLTSALSNQSLSSTDINQSTENVITETIDIARGSDPIKTNASCVGDEPPGSDDRKKDADADKADVGAEDTNESTEGKMLREYIRKRLSLAKVYVENRKPKRLPVYIPMHELMDRKKDPAVDKLNVYEERVAIQQKVFEKRKKILSVIPQAPQCYWEYMTFTGGYLLNGSRESRLSIPVLASPPSLCEPMTELFKAHEEKRVRLRVQHAIQREKLVISCEQEIMRVHCRAARSSQNQQIPYSVCAMLMDKEVYHMPRQNAESENGGKTSIRDRFNSRMFISWLQDVDDKYMKMKSALLARQKHEAEALFAVQKTEWILKQQELDYSQKALKPDEVNEIYVPMVNIADDFDLLPA